MRRLFLPIVAAVAAAGLFAAGFGLAAGGASTTKVSAKLAPRNERPASKGAAGATGLFTGTLTGSTLIWRLTFSRLTGKATAAHIHLGRAGVAGPVAVPLCGPCASGAHGKATLSSKTKAALLAGGAYVNVHTAKNAGGEIRGQVAHGSTAVPIPATTESQTDTSGGGTPGYGGYGG